MYCVAYLIYLLCVTLSMFSLSSQVLTLDLNKFPSGSSDERTSKISKKNDTAKQLTNAMLDEDDGGAKVGELVEPITPRSETEEATKNVADKSKFIPQKKGREIRKRGAKEISKVSPSIHEEDDESEDI